MNPLDGFFEDGCYWIPQGMSYIFEQLRPADRRENRSIPEAKRHQDPDWK